MNSTLLRVLLLAALLVLCASCSGDDSGSTNTTSDASETDASGNSTGDTSQNDVPADSTGSLDSSFDGLYETVVHQRARPCSTDMADADIAQRYFRLEAMVVESIPFLARYECTGDTVGTCSDTISFFQSMILRDEVWQYVLVAASYMGDECRVSITKGTPEFTSDGFEIDLTNRTGVVPGVEEEACNADVELEVDFDSLDCGFEEYFEYVRVL